MIPYARDIEGHVAVITGGAAGLGRSIAMALAQAGARVAVIDIDLAGAQAAAEEIGNGALALRTDVSASTNVAQAIDQVVRHFGGLQILVNNAGFSRDAPLLDMTDDEWDDVVDVSLKGAFLCSRAAARAMVPSRYGRIINMASRAHTGAINKANYSAAKAGILGLTRTLSMELGPSDITVNAVSPGLIRTERVMNTPYYFEIDRLSRESSSIKREGLPDDVANAVLFFASSRSGYITGENLHIAGGRH